MVTFLVCFVVFAVRGCVCVSSWTILIIHTFFLYINVAKKPVFDVGRRQTLLFSATAIHAAVHNASTTAFDKKAKAQKKLKLKGTLKGITQNNTLPDHLKQ